MAVRSMRQLQLAVDFTDLARAMYLLEQVHPCCDIVEVGTPLILEEGLGALAALKARFGDKQYLADTKIADAGHIEATSAFARGADIVTVLGVSDNATVAGALKAAREHNGQVMADLMHVADPIARARELAGMGVPILCLHTAFDRQGPGVDPLAELAQVRASVQCRLAIAGGITLENAPRAMALGADILVVGGGIITRPDPRAAAQAILDVIEKEAHRVGRG